uniref:MFS transporter n=1 Tax=Rhabditophanes sp. KR3021 TaxID=114890 RepID=A0AC35TYD1_9BILA
MFLFIAIGSSLAPLAIRRAISVGSIHQTVKNEDDLISLNFVHIHPTSYEVEDLTKINWEIISLHGLFCIFLCSIPIILHFVWSDRTYNEPTIKEFDFADKGQVSVGEGILVNLMVTALTTSDFLWMALTHHNVFDQRMHLGACLIPIGMVVLTRLFGLVFLPNITVTKYVIMGLFGFVVVYNAVTMLFIIKWYEEISTEGTINYSLFLILTPTSIISGLLPPLITTNLSKLISKNTSIFSENMIAANICSVFIANLIYNKDQVSLNLRVIPTLIDDYTKFILISLCCYVLIAVVPIKVMIKRINFKLKLTEQMMRGSKDEEEFLIEKL